MALLKFEQWLELESSATTRARRDIALGLKPLAALGSLDGGSTARPWERLAIEKQIAKNKKKRKKHKK